MIYETVSRLRPFARRFFKIRRPFFVLIRLRKPCVRFRRRLFGWYVRFIPFYLLPRLFPTGERPDSKTNFAW